MTSDAVLVDELTNLENAWWQALRDQDWERARGFMLDEFSITTAGWIDAPIGAEAWLQSLAGRYRLDHFDYDEVAVRRYGDVAIVQSRSHQSGTMLDGGAAWSGTFRYTDVWVRGASGGWKITVRHAGMRPSD